MSGPTAPFVLTSVPTVASLSVSPSPADVSPEPKLILTEEIRLYIQGPSVSQVMGRADGAVGQTSRGSWGNVRMASTPSAHRLRTPTGDKLGKGDQGQGIHG